LSGRIAIRLPPSFTQFARSVTWASVSGCDPRIATSLPASIAAVTGPPATSNSFSPSLRRISA
jgi:hypothetical protein